jgi:hypothetical protein
MKVYLLKSLSEDEQSQQYARLDPFNGWQTCDEWQHAYFFHSLDTALQFKNHLHWCGQYISNNVDFDFTTFRVVSRNID